MSAITKFLPKNHISYLIGKLVHLRGPRIIWTAIIKIFAHYYKINLDEAEFPVSDYPNLGEFFVRKLKPGLRPISSDGFSIHPADSVITQFQKIKNGKLIQAKNKFYDVNDFLKDDQALSRYNEGLFVTYYLCPTDYHRVHSAVDGVIQNITHIPGALWPVNKWSTENIDQMFSINERVVVEIQTEKGWVAAVFVAATNVGQIILSFDESIRGNQFNLDKPFVKTNINKSIKKGEELGMFRMGSTVVMLYQKSTITDRNLLSVDISSESNEFLESKKTAVKMGQICF